MKKSFIFPEAIAKAKFRKEILRVRRIVFEFFSQLTHERPQIFGLKGAVFPPDCSEERGVCDGPARMFHKMVQELEFLRRQT